MIRQSSSTAWCAASSAICSPTRRIAPGASGGRSAASTTIHASKSSPGWKRGSIRRSTRTCATSSASPRPTRGSSRRRPRRKRQPATKTRPPPPKRKAPPTQRPGTAGRRSDRDAGGRRNADRGTGEHDTEATARRRPPLKLRRRIERRLLRHAAQGGAKPESAAPAEGAQAEEKPDQQDKKAETPDVGLEAVAKQEEKQPEAGAAAGGESKPGVSPVSVEAPPSGGELGG